MAIKIAVANQKGGIGKTTTALCVAASLIKKKKKVLFVDTDPQRNSTKVYNAQIEDTETLADIMYGDTPASECVQKTEMGDIIASDDQLSSAETQIQADIKRFTHLSRSMKTVEDDYDYIIFDTPPGKGVLLGNVLMYVDYLIIPVTCDAFGVQGLADFYSTIKDYKEGPNEKLQIAGILRIKYKGRQNLTREIEDEILPQLAKDMDTKLFKTVIRESVKCQEAQTLQQSLFDYAPTCTTAEDYTAFLKELLKTVGGK